MQAQRRSRLHSFVILALAGSLACVAACDDDGNNDLGGAVDLLGADLPISLPDLASCPPPAFNGFPGDSTTERRLDCSVCGCSIDTLSKAAEEGLWNKTTLSATLSDSAPGVYVVADGSLGPAFASLTSLNPGGPFYLDGDFDLRMDYATSAFPYAARIALRVDVPSGEFFEISRGRTVLGAAVYSSTLASIPGEKPASLNLGTLQIVRHGAIITVYGDGTQVAMSSAAGSGRAAIFLSAGLEGCGPSDAGVPDSGGCTLAATMHDIRLASGALVDRR